MIAALMLMSLLALIAIAVLSMSAADRRRAIRLTRTEVREGCGYSGLTYARTYFANNFANWNTYLGNPTNYNPINLPTTTGGWGAEVKADLSTPSSIGLIQASKPELFLDLDNDGASDVYIFIRDNRDEFGATPVNFKRDNDQNVIVGAVCISTTMVPKREDNSIDTDRLVVESMMSYNMSPPSPGNYNE